MCVIESKIAMIYEKVVIQIKFKLFIIGRFILYYSKVINLNKNQIL